jgi:hypothetical protein
MLMVLIYEGVIKGNRIKVGGKLSKMVKHKTTELNALLNKQKNNATTEQNDKQSSILYLRLNTHV